MKREIKFRAWITNKNSSMTSITTKDGKTYTEYMDYDVTLSHDGHYLSIEGCDIQDKYDKVPIMQYTGLKDKNSVEIYDGDIVKSIKKDDVVGLSGYTAPYLQEIIFNERYVCLMLKHTTGNKQENFIDKEQFDYWRDYEVVGNIYENPELLSN